MDLEQAQLENAILVRGFLIGTLLHLARLDGAVLLDADLEEAVMHRASLVGAHLQRANLTRSIVAEAAFRGADLRDADITQADLRGADLSGADLSTYRNKASPRKFLPSDWLSLTRDEQTNSYSRAMKSLLQSQLNEACGDAETKLPEGLTIPFRDDGGDQTSRHPAR